MAKKKVENMTFEEAVSELETIVADLESGDLSLEDSMALFERGLKLSHTSHAKLSDAEQKIELLIKENGQTKLQNFDDAGLDTE